MEAKTFTKVVDDNTFVVDLGAISKVRSWTPEKMKKKVNWEADWLQEIFGVMRTLSGRTYGMVAFGMISESHLDSIHIVTKVLTTSNAFLVETDKGTMIGEWIILFKKDKKKKVYVPWRMSSIRTTMYVRCIPDAGYGEQ